MSKEKLTLCFDEENMKELGWSELPKIGSTFEFISKIEIVATTCSQNKSTYTCMVKAQILDMKIPGRVVVEPQPILEEVTTITDAVESSTIPVSAFVKASKPKGRKAK